MMMHYFLTLIGIIALDRISKMWALSALRYNALELIPCVRFDLVLNRGVTWGMFGFAGTLGFSLVALVTTLVVVLLAWYTWQEACRGNSVLAYVLMLGGAVSNLFDRFAYGGVIDFIELYIGNYSWPTFNVADMFLVFGACGLILQMVEQRR